MQILQLRDRVVDLSACVVQHGATQERLTSGEQRLLQYLADRAGQAVSRDDLLAEVWGYASGVRSRAVQATVQRLRVKIEADPANPVHLKTIYGVGYRLDLPTPRASSPARATVNGFFGHDGVCASIQASLGQDRVVVVTGPPGCLLYTSPSPRD